MNGSNIKKDKYNEQILKSFQKKLEQIDFIGYQDIEYNAFADNIWELIVAFEGYEFMTYKGLYFSYYVKGNELFVDRKQHSKSITRLSVDMAVKEALALRLDGIKEYGFKKLKVFGAGYLWTIFRRFGL